MKKKLVAVTIPIYKAIPDTIELISLTQCLKVLTKHPLVFFGPDSLDTSFYERFCDERSIDFRIERYADHYFSGIKGYNELMLSKDFYERFLDFKYILIYQLDAFVFRDELAYWCKQGYDYIGAPYLFVDYDTYPIRVLSKYRWLLQTINKIIPGSYSYRRVGNGGFSLRNVKKSLFLLQFQNINKSLWKTLMEDNFFSYWGNILFPLYKLAPEKIAVRFAIEIDAERSYNFANNALPFGCHAFMRYDKNFWKPFIEREGYNID